MARFAALVTCRITFDAINHVDAERILKEKALQFLIEQAPPVKFKDVTLQLGTEQ